MSTPHRRDGIGRVMTSTVVSVEPSASVRRAAAVLRDANVGAVAVVHGDEVAGVFSERDVVRVAADGGDLDAVLVADAMAAGPRYLTLADTVTGAAEMMVDAGVRHLPVVDEGDLVGIVSIRDVVPALLTGS